MWSVDPGAGEGDGGAGAAEGDAAARAQTDQEFWEMLVQQRLDEAEQHVRCARADAERVFDVISGTVCRAHSERERAEVAEFVGPAWTK